MSMKNTRRRIENDPTLIEDVTHKYLPYWPLFVLLAVPCLIAAWAYVKYKTPVYEITAVIRVKDEKKGVNEDQITESLNLLSSKTIVENEVEIIHSRNFVDAVVKDLHLYAPIYQQGEQKSVSAYISSPVNIEVADFNTMNEAKKVFFTYDYNKRTVNFDGAAYPINKFVATKYGMIKFIRNPHFSQSTKDKLYFSIYKPHKITEGVFKNLDVSSVGKLSSIIKIKYKDEVPMRGEDIVNAVIQKYNASTVSYKTQLAKNTMAFLEARITAVANDLNDAEKKIQRFRSQKGVVNLTDQSRLYLQNVAMNDQKVADISMQMSVLNQVEKYVTSKDNAAKIVPSTLGVNDPLLPKLLEKLYDAELQYEKLRQTTAENNPAVTTVANQIQTLKPAILENIQNQKASLEAGRNNLSTTNSGYNSILQTIPQKERELVDVSRDHATKTNLYNFLLQKREQTALAYSSAIAESQIVDEAKSSVLPVSPNKKFIYAAALVFALMLTIGFVLYRDILSNKILFRSEIEKYTNVPVLGEIGYVKKTGNSLFADNGNLKVQDEFRQLLTAAGLFSKNNKKKRILITSSIENEGKTFMCANLAYNLAQSGKKVVLLDMDMRESLLSQKIKGAIAAEAGVAEFLSGKVSPEAVVSSTEYENLSLVKAGNTNQNSTSLLLNGRIEQLFEYLDQQFDFIVVDSPSVNPASDAYILSAHFDMTLYVVGHRITPKACIRKLDEVNELKPLKDISLVFNGIKPRGFLLKNKAMGYGA